jgi:phosphatidylglycerol:prolipoprotein diacylglycerol transferase
MYPVLFRIGEYEITSFGAFVALGALVGLWILRRELRLAGLPDSGTDAGIAGVLGGVVGAKLLWVSEHLDEGPFFQLLFSRGGMSWFGGFFGGLLAGIVAMWFLRLPVVRVLAAATPGLAVGHAIGRIGCLLVGDDYGRPTDLPWGVRFPEGLPPTDVPVHPTMIYEAIALVPFAWWLVRLRRRGTADRTVLGTYLVGAGAIRFVIEFLRINVRVLGPLSVAHLAALAAIIVGIGVLATRRGSSGNSRSGTP